MGVKTSWQWGDKVKVARAAGSPSYSATSWAGKACPAGTAVRLEAACLTYGTTSPRNNGCSPNSVRVTLCSRRARRQEMSELPT